MPRDRSSGKGSSADRRAHLLAMFEKAPIHFSVEPARFRLVTFNTAFAQRFRAHRGIEPQAGMSLDELLPREPADLWRSLFQRALVEGSVRTEHVSVLDARIMLLTLDRLDEDGTPFGIAARAVDVSEHRRALGAVAEMQVRLAAVVESTQDLIWSVDPERFGLSTFNSALASYFKRGRDLDIHVGMGPEEMLPPAFAAQWQALYARALAEGSFVTEYRTAAQGKTLLLSVNRMERAGRVFGISVFGKDITERKAAELALAESEARFRTLVEDSPVAIGVARRDLRIAYVNRTYAKLLGATPEGLVGLPVIEQWAPDSRAQLAGLFERLLREEQGIEFESLCQRSDGSVFPAHAAVAVLRRGSDPIGVVFLTDISERRKTEAQLQQTLGELQSLRDRLQQDNLALRQQIVVQQAPPAILGRSRAIAKALEQAKAVAPTDSAVLITGETGTGKELLARTIHEMSPRAARPMVTVNCAALPPGLIESELFGREKGAFTGASSRQKGRFETADGSTLFLDEVAELPLELQAKLLRVLQDGCFERLGSAQTVSVDVRVIAATNRDLAEMVGAGRFRSDLYYRLRVFPIEVPPLRERAEDIPGLVWDAVRSFAQKVGKTIDSIPPDTMRRLQEHPWPGNVRELRNVMERAVIVSADRTLSVAFELADAREGPPVTLEDAERRHILATLERTGWRIDGEGGAAQRLAVNRSTLQSMMKRLGISRPRH
jgi:PAS domain S-box-containing protein